MIKRADNSASKHEKEKRQKEEEVKRNSTVNAPDAPVKKKTQRR